MSDFFNKVNIQDFLEILLDFRIWNQDQDPVNSEPDPKLETNYSIVVAHSPLTIIYFTELSWGSGIPFWNRVN